MLADRGLYAPWLFHHIVKLGWHPFLRINLGGKVRPLGTEQFDWLSTLVPTPQQRGVEWWIALSKAHCVVPCLPVGTRAMPMRGWF